jgi:hypothetical protein
LFCKILKIFSFSLSLIFKALISCLIFLGGFGHLSAKCPDYPQLKHFSCEKYLSNLDSFFVLGFLNFLGEFFEVEGLLNFLFL